MQGLAGGAAAAIAAIVLLAAVVSDRVWLSDWEQTHT
jgi:hypothetical protein